MTSDGRDNELWRAACALNGRAGLSKPLPPLFFVTDPDRTPDPAAIARRLPRGAGVIYRSFGAADEVETAAALREVCTRRGLVFLVGQSPIKAVLFGADGVHLPERDLENASMLRRDRPQWLLTGAAHSAQALARAAQAGLDAALLSPVFESASPSAGPPLGVEGFTAFVRGAGLPVYALGGVGAATATALEASGAAGIAAVQGVLEAYR